MYHDSPALRETCRLRNASNNRALKAALSKQINITRRTQRYHHTSWLCEQVANMQWNHTRELLQIIENEKPKTLGTCVDDTQGCKYGLDMAHKWPEVFESFWKQTFHDCETNLQIVRDNLCYLCMNVIAVVMYAVMDGTFQPLININTLESAIGGLRANKAVDDNGLAAEAVMHLDDDGKEHLLKLFNERADSTDIDKCALDDGYTWSYVSALLFPKLDWKGEVDKVCVIHIVPVLCKVYLRCLLVLVNSCLHFGGWIQIGGRKAHQAVELVLVLRLVIEKCTEWSRGWVIVSLEIKKAYDSISIAAVSDFLVCAEGVPLRLKYALLKEMASQRQVRLKGMGFITRFFPMLKGVRQGSPESTILFAHVINKTLLDLSASWRNRGIGMCFCKWGGNEFAFDEWWAENGRYCNWNVRDVFCSVIAYLDDIYIIARSVPEAQLMLDEVVTALLKLGLELQTSKVKWIADSSVDEDCKLLVDGMPVTASASLVASGSEISSDNSQLGAFRHRTIKAWANYRKWSHILESKASLSSRFVFRQKTVGRSLAWGLETCRPSAKGGKMLQTTQRLMIRKMMRLRRRVIVIPGDAGGYPGTLEPWLDWQIRSMREAKSAININNACARNALLDQRQRFVDHIGRFGVGHRVEVHLCKALLLWRPFTWWKKQQWFNELGWDAVVHKARIGMINAFDRHLADDWLAVANS